MAKIDQQSPLLIFEKLPNELVNKVFRLLSNRDIKNLRQTCRRLSEQLSLRFDRIFISANPLDIKVFLAVANHHVFRHQVKEIIWDDATFVSLAVHSDNSDFGYSDDELETDAGDYRGSSRFHRHCREELDYLESRLADKKNGDKQKTLLDNLMPSRESLSYYTCLVEEQNQVIETGADEEAFRYVLQKSRFPHLTKVTVTPAAHGFLFFPLHDTPLIRAFPRGFVYPIPRGWTCSVDVPRRANPWNEEDEQRKWRGFRIVSRVLADPKITHNISELSFDNHKLLSGINHFVFDHPNEEYNNLCLAVQRPRFKAITVSLLMGWLSDWSIENWSFLQKGKIRGLLAKAPDLERITLQTDYPVDETCWAGPLVDRISLFDIFPVDLWSSMNSLKHFGLSGLQVSQDELISVIAKLPSTLQTIELSFLSIIQGTGNHAGILADIRDKLGWRHRRIDQRIRIRMLVRISPSDAGRYICVDQAVNDYIYGDAPPPFGVSEYGRSYGRIERGAGMQYDEFDPEFMQPYS